MTDCIVYRCSKQPEMYLYLRADLKIDDMPEAMRLRAGRLTEVMRLTLAPTRKLARVDVVRVIERLRGDGWYLQLPPDGIMDGHLDDGD